MGQLMIPDWTYPFRRSFVSQAEQWTRQHGFHSGSAFTNSDGEKLADLLDAEPDVLPSGVVFQRWTFRDGSAVVVGQGTWRLAPRQRLWSG